MITRVTTEFVRRHYSIGPTAYREDGSIAKMPTAEDIAYCEQQFDAWLIEHDAAIRAAEQERIASIVRGALGGFAGNNPSLGVRLAETLRLIAQASSHIERSE